MISKSSSARTNSSKLSNPCNRQLSHLLSSSNSSPHNHLLRLNLRLSNLQGNKTSNPRSRPLNSLRSSNSSPRNLLLNLKGRMGRLNNPSSQGSKVLRQEQRAGLVGQAAGRRQPGRRSEQGWSARARWRSYRER